MKKSSFTPALIIFSISLMVIGVLSFKYQQNPIVLNDKKSKLTILDNVKKTAQKLPVLNELIRQNIDKQNAQTNSEQKAPSILASERVYTENEIQKMTEAQFSELLTETKNKLPKLSDIKKLPPGVLHHTPPLVIEAGRDLGLIKEVLKVHESFESLATPFYQACAKDNVGVTPVRALCLTNLIELKKKSGQEIKMSDYPEQIIQLTRMVTDL